MLAQSQVPMLGSMGTPPHGTLSSPPLDGSGSQRRTFKAKLQEMVQEAELQELQAAKQNSMQDKKSLSISLLVEGRPSAFCDFFRLTHGAEASTSAPAGSSDGELPLESLLLLKAQLVKADEAQRQGRTEEVYAAYKSLAKYFAQLGRLRTAEFFFQHGLNTAHNAGWLPGELEANLALGVVYEELQDTKSAITCHERRLELAGQHMMTADMETAYASLTNVYLGQAEKQEKSGDTAGALDSYAKCLKAAERSGDTRVQAQAHYRTGMLYQQRSRWPEAMFHLRAYLERADALGDKVAEGVANTTLAQCLRETGDTSSAVELLEAFLEASQRSSEQKGPAIACCLLGATFYEQHDFDRAVKYFERFFEIARALDDRRVVDTARFNLGVARGAQRMSKFMTVVDTDIIRLLHFKNSRAEL